MSYDDCIRMKASIYGTCLRLIHRLFILKINGLLELSRIFLPLFGLMLF